MPVALYYVHQNRSVIKIDKLLVSHQLLALLAALYLSIYYKCLNRVEWCYLMTRLVAVLVGLHLE